MTKTTKTTTTATTKSTTYGRMGSASELYKYVIAALGLDNAEAWSAVASVLGPDAAGGPNYPSWYRCALRRAGVR